MKSSPTDVTAVDIHPELLRFLRETITTFARWDLVRFFHDNPHATEIAENIAKVIVRPTSEVERELNALVAAGVLTTSKAGDVQVYRLGSDAATLRKVHAFVTACDDREFRMRAIREVINQMP